MPKKTIMSASHQQPFRPAVGWEAGADVQLGIQVWNAGLGLVDVLFGAGDEHSDEYYDSELARLGKLVSEKLQAQFGVSVETPPEEEDLAELGQLVLDSLREARDYVERDGIWTSLNRAAINDLIAALRKARDSAYGRDM